MTYVSLAIDPHELLHAVEKPEKEYLDRLFDNMLRLTNENGERRFKSIYEIFHASLPEAGREEAGARCGLFLRDMTTCPSETRLFCEQTLRRVQLQ